jgi:trehalose/maltose transport system substrate-binding protein
VLEACPFFGELYDTFVNAVARPSRVTGERYNRVSNAFWSAGHDVLSGSAMPASGLAISSASSRASSVAGNRDLRGFPPPRQPQFAARPIEARHVSGG